MFDKYSLKNRPGFSELLIIFNIFGINSERGAAYPFVYIIYTSFIILVVKNEVARFILYFSVFIYLYY